MADGDPEIAVAGLGAVLEAERRQLLRFLVARCGDAAEAEDLLQELWLKAAKATAGPIANPRAYLFSMANNLVLDRARRRRRSMIRDRAWIEHDEPISSSLEARPDPAPNAEMELLQAEESFLVRRAVEALPVGARRAILLYRFEGRAQAEIAQIMGISQSGVEKHLALAMKRLRRSLKDCGYFGVAASKEQEMAGDEAPSRDSMS